MIIILMIMIALVVMLALHNIYSRLNTAFVMTVFGFCLIITALVFYIMKTSYYNGIFELELRVYSMMRSVRVNIDQIKLIVLCGYSVIFVSQVIVFCEMCGKKAAGVCVSVVSAVLLAVFLMTNVPNMSERIYIRLTESFSVDKIGFANKLFKGFNYTVMMYFLILPMPAIVRSIRCTEMLFKKRQNVFIMLSFGVVDAVIILFSAFTRISNLMSAFSVNMFESRFLNYGEYEIVILVSAMFILLIISFAIVKFDIFGNVDFLRNIMINKKMKMLVMDLRYVFHDFKNMLMTIIALSRQAETGYGTEDGKKALKKISTAAMEYAQKLSDLQSIYKQKKVRFDSVDLFSQVKEAVSRLAVETTVRIYIANYPENPVVPGDAYQIQSVCYNIIKNAVESVERKGENGGIVEIRFIEDVKWLCVEFKDNGEGFEPRQLRRLWLPFSSGKNTFLNWGIGLNQARKIMSAHLGHIDVKSKRGKYAVIQTAFLRNL